MNQANRLVAVTKAAFARCEPHEGIISMTVDFKGNVLLHLDSTAFDAYSVDMDVRSNEFNSEGYNTELHYETASGKVFCLNNVEEVSDVA